MVCGVGGGPVDGLGLMLAGGYCGPPWSPRGPKGGGPLFIGGTPAFGGSDGGPVVKGGMKKDRDENQVGQKVEVQRALALKQMMVVVHYCREDLGWRL
jgi:hypothetical protein